MVWIERKGRYKKKGVFILGLACMFLLGGGPQSCMVKKKI